METIQKFDDVLIKSMNILGMVIAITKKGITVRTIEGIIYVNDITDLQKISNF